MRVPSAPRTWPPNKINIRPSRDRRRETHRDMSRLHLSNHGKKFLENRSLKELVTVTPKYLNPSSAILKGNIFLESALANWFTQNNSLIWIFNLYPDTLLNCFRIDSIGGREDAGFEMYKRRSSA